jgi:hypothetical protein
MLTCFFLYNTIFFYISTKLIRKVYKYWEAAKLSVVVVKFPPNFNFCLEACFNINITDSYFPWNSRLRSFIFKRIPAKYTSLNNNSFITHSSGKKIKFCEKKVCLNSQVSHTNVFWQDYLWSLTCSKDDLFFFFKFITQEY